VMSQFAQCLVLEWGWGFLIWVGIGLLLLCGVLATLIIFFGLRPRSKSGKLSSKSGKVGWHNFTLTGYIVNFVVFLAVIGVVGYGLILGFSKYGTTYSVSFDTASGPSKDLGELRDWYQPDTQVTILIKDHARRFPVTGRYEGACVQDLFESICRQYNSKLSCNTSILSRTITIDLR
jgi:hypothetical protein